jgi:hypothetical protein
MQVTLNIFRFDHRIGGGGGAGPDTLRVAGFFAFDPPDLTTPDQSADFSSQSQSFETQTYNLTDFTFASPATVRFYGWNGGDGASTFSLDNIQFQGSVSAVPEPRFYAVAAGLGLATFAFARRRRA